MSGGFTGGTVLRFCTSCTALPLLPDDCVVGLLTAFAMARGAIELPDVEPDLPAGLFCGTFRSLHRGGIGHECLEKPKHTKRE